MKEYITKTNLGSYFSHKAWFIYLVLITNFLLKDQSVAFEDTLIPYSNSEMLPASAKELWSDYDPRKEALETNVIREWKQDGVITRYVTFKVGTFKGADSRIAAYYSFPDNGMKNPAFVWSHGGGQRAERTRGIYFAQMGFATLDINWLGRSLEEGIKENTDWGRVDPTQGPRFYPKALRDSWKQNLLPDKFTIDPIPSPRNSNWFILALAGRRALTFLEQQSEVDPSRIGFSGYSMGGMITALVAFDPRLKAVAPFVGGTGFKYIDFPGGIRGSSIRGHFKHLELYKSTIDASAYWPMVACPVLFITSSNDFHSTFERIYQSMALLSHNQWRVSCNVHQNHGPGPQQWVLLNLWFNKYLKGENENIPLTPPSNLVVRDKSAQFTVTPLSQSRLLNTEIYYSYDPNSRTRFWKTAKATRSENQWIAELKIEEGLPLYVFGLCRYSLSKTVPLERGESSAFTLNTREHVFLPEEVNLDGLRRLKKTDMVFEDFKHGTRDWSSRDGRGIQTYKFQNPELDTSQEKQLCLTINPEGRNLLLRLRIGSKFLRRGYNLGDFTYTKSIHGENLVVIKINRNDFNHAEGKILEWDKISTFGVSILDQASKKALDLTLSNGHGTLQLIELVDRP